MLLDVGLQHCVEVLEFSVSDEPDDVYLPDIVREERLWEFVKRLQSSKTFKRQMRIFVWSSDSRVYLGKDGRLDIKDVKTRWTQR